MDRRDTIDSRVAVLEQRVTSVEVAVAKMSGMNQRLTALQQDVSHVLQGAASINVSLERLTDALVDQRITAAAANAMGVQAMKDVRATLDELKASRLTGVWPPAAKATVMASALTAATAALVALL